MKKQESTKIHDAVKRGVCNFCATGCGIKVFTKDNKVVDIFGDEEHPINKGALCPRSMWLYGLNDINNRLLKPLVRSSVQESWHEASWEDALNEIVIRLRKITENSSPQEKIVFSTSPSDPFDYIAGASCFARNLTDSINVEFGCPSPFSNDGALHSLIGVPGSELMTNPPQDWAMSRAVLLVGGDLTSSSPISFGPLQDMRDRGGKLLYLGSSGGMTAFRASESLLVRLGTEAVALSGIINIILENEWINNEYLSENTIGLSDLRKKLSTYTASRVASICGVNQKELELFAYRLGHTSPIQVQTAFTRYYPYQDNSLLSMCCALVILRGSIGIPGGGCNIYGVSPFRDGYDFITGKHRTFSGQHEQLSRMKANAIFGYGNCLPSSANSGILQSNINQCQLVVHFGSFIDESMEYAHIALPVAHWSEYAHLIDVSNSRTLQWQSAFFDRPIGSWEPLEVWTKLMGIWKDGATTPWGTEKTSGELVSQRKMTEWALASNFQTTGISLKDLDTDNPNIVSGGMLWPCTQQDDVDFEKSRYIKGNIRGRNILFTADRNFTNTEFRFPTEDGKIHLETCCIPDLDIKLSGDIPLVLCHEISKPVEGFSTGNNVDQCQVRVHPNTADKYGLANGQRVVLSTENGEAIKEAFVLLNGLIPENVLAMAPDQGYIFISKAYAMGIKQSLVGIKIMSK
jgi:anaerobic selenocysteine-containing dehydrogenase